LLSLSLYYGTNERTAKKTQKGYVSLLQQRAEEVLKMDARTFGSAPRDMPRFIASETPIIEIASTRLLQIFAI
jgi:hypothetical protein